MGINVASTVDPNALFAPISLGKIGYAEVAANQGTFTALTDLTGLSVAVTVGSGRRIRVIGHVGSSSSANSDTVELQIRESSTTLTVARVQLGTSGAGFMTVHAEVVLTPSAGSHTYKLSMGRNSGTGNITSVAAANVPGFILVEDIGT